MTVIERSFWETLDDPASPITDHGMDTPANLSHWGAKKQNDLESSTTSTVWGAAYHIPASHAEEVHDYLDDREIDGYTVHYTPFHPVSPTTSACETPTCQTPSAIDPGNHHPAESHPPITAKSLSTTITCMVYIGLPTNPQFLRDPVEREPAAVATVISAGVGQSGRNPEYLYLLEKALEGLGLATADGHITDLVRRVKAIEQQGNHGQQADRQETLAKEKAQRSPAVDCGSPQQPDRGTYADDFEI